MNLGKLPQLAGGLAAAGVMLLVALYVIRPHQTEVTSPEAHGPTAAHSVYPSIIVEATWTPEPAPDTSTRVLDVESGDVRVVPAPGDLTLVTVLSSGSLLFTKYATGPAQLITLDGSTVSQLDMPATREFRVSLDRRYVMWTTIHDSVQFYDAQTKTTTTTIPSGARFDTSLPDGAVLARGGVGTFIVDPDGTIEATLNGVDANPAWTSDGRKIAWFVDDNLHIYDRDSRQETIDAVSGHGDGKSAWSPDRLELALMHFNGSATVVLVLDAATRKPHDVYVAPSGNRVDSLSFVAPHTLQFEVLWPELSGSGEFFPGPRYQINDDGTGGHFVDPADPPWAACGPRCGMPPEGYESPRSVPRYFGDSGATDTSGIARWCESRATSASRCDTHLVYVDRAHGIVHELITTDDYRPVAVSEDRKFVAFTLGDTERNQTVRVVRLDDFTSRDFDLGFTFANSLTWLSDGHSLLLAATGGN